MTISTISSKHESQVAKEFMWQQLPNDCFSRVFSFLDPREVAAAERVNSSWRGMIGSHDQDAWKEQCRIQNIIVDNPGIAHIEQVLGSYFSKEVGRGEVEEGFDSRTMSIITSYDDGNRNVGSAVEEVLSEHTGGNFNSRIVSIIISYNGESIFYKKFATIIRGNILCHHSNSCLVMSDKTDRSWNSLRWGHSENELFVRTKIYSSESFAACKAHHGKKCRSTGWQGTWQDIHPRLGTFPSWLPLRFFINRDGNYKQDGDTMTLRYKGQMIMLTCVHTLPNSGRHRITGARPFAECMARQVEERTGDRTIYLVDVEQAKIAAQKTPDWISSD